MSYLERQPISGNFQVLDALIATTTDTYALTKDTAIACVISMSDTTEADMQSNLSAQIEEQKNPEVTSKTKEW